MNRLIRQGQKTAALGESPRTSKAVQDPGSARARESRPYGARRPGFAGLPPRAGRESPIRIALCCARGCRSGGLAASCVTQRDRRRWTDRRLCGIDDPTIRLAEGPGRACRPAQPRRREHRDLARAMAVTALPRPTTCPLPPAGAERRIGHVAQRIEALVEAELIRPPFSRAEGSTAILRAPWPLRRCRVPRRAPCRTLVVSERLRESRAQIEIVLFGEREPYVPDRRARDRPC
jgi:hypothetical protein